MRFVKGMFVFFLCPLLGYADICGKIAVIDNSAPATDLEVILMTSSREILRKEISDAEGLYRFADVSLGEYLVEAQAPIGTVAISSNPFSVVLSDKNKEGRASFFFGLPTRLEGCVANKHGASFAEATVELLNGSQVIASTKTDGLGGYFFESLPPKPVLVRVSPVERESMVQSILLSSGTVNRLDFFLKDPPEVNVEVVEPIIETAFIAPPVSGKGKVGKSAGGRKVHTLKWSASPDSSVVAYHIYMRGNKIGEVSAAHSRYTNKQVVKGHKTYQIFAVNSLGETSSPLTIEVK